MGPGRCDHFPLSIRCETERLHNSMMGFALLSYEADQQARTASRQHSSELLPSRGTARASGSA